MSNEYLGFHIILDDALSPNVVELTGRKEIDYVQQIRELTAELKELREFVGAMHNCVLADGAFCCEVDDGVWHLTDVHDDLLASGTDPFDAWRKMNAGEVE